jgi:acyl-CoA synthetase (AMP-forming)/AMP-acid ligase II
VFALRTLHDALRLSADIHPDRRAFGVWGDRTETKWMSFGELDRSCRAAASQLQDRLPRDARVLLVFPPGLDFITAFYACSYAGLIAVPAYPPDPARLERTLPRLRAICADAGATAVLTTRAILERLAPVTRLVPELAGLHWVAIDDGGDADAWREPGTGSDDVAFLQYTSGSTGDPKGVVLTYGNLLHNAEAIRRAHRYSTDTRMVTWLPPYHDMGLIGSIVQPAYTGFSCLHMAPSQFLMKPLRWLEAITQEGGTSSGAPNFAYDLCAQKVTEEQKSRLDLSTWEVAYCGAELIRADTVARFSRAFASCGFKSRAWYPCYGLAEGTLIVTGIDKGAGVHARPFEGGAAVGVGGLVTGGEMIIVDPATCARLPEGEVGEVWVQSGSIARGYWNRPADTEATFGARTADGAGPFLRTGDLGFLVGKELHITGRRKEMILVRGRKLYPTDIESTVEDLARGQHFYRAGGTVAFGGDLGGDERMFVAVEIERRQAPRRDGAPAAAAPQRDLPAGKDRRGPDRRRRPFDYRDAPTAHQTLPDIARAVRAAVAAEHGVEPYGVYLLRPGSVPKTSSGKKQRVLLGRGLLAESLGKDVLFTWRADRVTTSLREVA